MYFYIEHTLFPFKIILLFILRPESIVICTSVFLKTLRNVYLIGKLKKLLSNQFPKMFRIRTIKNEHLFTKIKNSKIKK